MNAAIVSPDGIITAVGVGHAVITIFDDAANMAQLTVDVIPFEPEETTPCTGDANGDGDVNLKDVVAIRRYLAGGWEQTFFESAADVNKDKSIDLKDVVMLRRYLAGGFGITL